MGHVRGTVLNSFSANDKFVAWYSNSKVMIWNRHSLKVEEACFYFFIYIVIQEIFLLD